MRRPGEPDASDEIAKVSIFALIRLTDEDVRRLQDAGLSNMIERRGDPDAPGYYLRLKEDGTCAALLSSKLCGIYSARPTICRAFPFYFDLFAGLSMVASCPGVGKGESTVYELREEIHAAIKMYAFWIEQVLQALGDVKFTGRERLEAAVHRIRQAADSEVGGTGA